jgi:hypothetical protein
MDIIGSHRVWSFITRDGKATSTTCQGVRKAPAHKVTSYIDLARKVAELQFMNRDLVLLFRGQPCDYRNKQENSSLKPSIFRVKSDPKKVPKTATLAERFTALRRAEKLLVEKYRDEHSGKTRLARQQILRWAILQHYEVCDTPLLDVTHSLRIAASFASDNSGDKGFVFVLGVPVISGAITASAEAGLQIVRLASVCPPSAVRPHIQEGYALGEYPDFQNASQKDNYEYYELDFGRRLVAKFEFQKDTFWNTSGRFPCVGHNALYPDKRDPLFVVAKVVQTELNRLGEL